MPNETKNYGTVITTAGAALIAKCILNGGKVNVTRTHHMSVAATRT